MPYSLLASPFLSPNIERLIPAGATHAIPDSQPTEESPGKRSWDGMLPSQQNDARKQQRPLTLLRAAAAKRALDRDGAGRKAKPAKQPRSGDSPFLQNTVATSGLRLPLMIYIEHCLASHVNQAKYQLLHSLADCFTGSAAERRPGARPSIKQEQGLATPRDLDGAQGPRRIPSRLLPWACQRCTLDNAGTAVQCKACRSHRNEKSTQGLSCLFNFYRLGDID